MGTNIGIQQNSNLTQQLNLAPQLLNWLKILQASTTELSDLVGRELASNPALETAEADGLVQDDGVEGVSGESEFGNLEVGERLGALAEIDDEWRTADEAKLSSSRVLQDKHDFMMDHLQQASTLQSTLEQAIRVAELSPEEALAANLMSGSLNARGYLDVALEEVARAIGLDGAEAETALRKFQALAPPGIGARDLRECLVLQLRALDTDTELAETLVERYLDHLAANRTEALADHLGIETAEVEAALRLIRSLNPEPGRDYESAPVEYVEADLEIRCKDGGLEVELLDERLPKLQLSSYCKRLLEASRGSKEDLDYIRGKVRAAGFLIEGISQRQETMLKVAREIMRVQREFLSDPEGALQPLTMNKVAAMIGVHETTVSRAIANKYIRTERGLFEMRSFFKVGYRCADGSAVTPERVKKQLQAFVVSEEALKPLTDAHLSERFKKQGLKVARRTVAKYREELGIPSSKERLAQARRTASGAERVAV